jgi:antirestriction protein
MPSIYVASLSDYGAGRLHGEWIELDADTEPRDVWQCIEAMLAASLDPDAEDFAIHDYEGFGPMRLGEWDQVERVVFLARLIAEHGETAVGAFASDVVGENYDFTADDFCDAYRGEYDSPEEFAQELVIDAGLGYRGLSPQQAANVADILDWEAIATDLSDTFQYVEHGRHVLVFDRI